jgi:hypothetical protein
LAELGTSALTTNFCFKKAYDVKLNRCRNLADLGTSAVATNFCFKKAYDVKSRVVEARKYFPFTR